MLILTHMDTFISLPWFLAISLWGALILQGVQSLFKNFNKKS